MSPATILDAADLFRLVGLLGAAVYIGNYVALAFRLQDTSGITYFAAQATAASCVMTSLLAEFNVATLVIQTFFLMTSVTAIWMRLRRPAGRDAGNVPETPANSPREPRPLRGPMTLTRTTRRRARGRL